MDEVQFWPRLICQLIIFLDSNKFIEIGVDLYNNFQIQTRLVNVTRKHFINIPFETLTTIIEQRQALMRAFEIKCTKLLGKNQYPFKLVKRISTASALAAATTSRIEDAHVMKFCVYGSKQESSTTTTTTMTTSRFELSRKNLEMLLEHSPRLVWHRRRLKCMLNVIAAFYSTLVALCVERELELPNDAIFYETCNRIGIIPDYDFYTLYLELVSLSNKIEKDIFFAKFAHH